GRTGVHLVVDQVMQLQIVHVANGDGPLETIAGPAIVQPGLCPGVGELELFGDVVGIGQTQHVIDFFFGGTVEYWGGKRHAVAQIAGHLDDLVVAQIGQAGRSTHAVVDLVEVLAQRLDLHFTLDRKSTRLNSSHVKISYAV